MVLSSNDVDIVEFLANLKASKPPYECPFRECGKIYKSYMGMKSHMLSFNHVTGSKDNGSPNLNQSSYGKKGRGRWHGRKLSRSPSPSDFIKNPAREALTYAEAQRMVEIEIDGRTHRININEPMNIIQVDARNGFSMNGSTEETKEENGEEMKSEETSTPRGGKTGRGVRGGKGGKGGKCGKGKNRGKAKFGRPSKNKQQAPVEPQTPLTNGPVLPKPSFRVLTDYNPPDAPPRPTSYFRFIDKSPDELDEEVEYDMDEEDCAWLELINSKRKSDGLNEVPADTFELLMDRLEKESYFSSQNSGKEMGPAIDEDAVCCICSDGECQNTNAILFCDMCNLAVHQECYGVPYIPEGQWLCRRCLQSPSRAVDCVLCPNKGGAFKQTDDNRWAHVVCALWIPEVCFANTVFLEPIDSIQNIPTARWRLTCSICKQKSVGACIQCHKNNCYVAFHVTCAQQAGLYMKMEAIKEATPNGVITTVRKAAYCLTHTPTDENGVSLSGVYVSGDDDDSRSSFIKRSQNEALYKEKMRKARKMLAEKRSVLPVVSIPTIPADRLTKIASLINIPKRNQFIQRLLGYWTLKRHSRNGVPLLRRLQISYAGARKGNDLNNDDEQAIKLRDELKYLQRLRQDLEKARLLVELIRKREKLKLEYIKVHQLIVETSFQPLSHHLRKVLTQLEAKDTQKIFAEPVDVTEVTDYLNFISHPMDFSTMRSKIESNAYKNFSQFEADIHLMINNCMTYNNKDTLYYKAAVKLNEASKSILREARTTLEKPIVPKTEDDNASVSSYQTASESNDIESKEIENPISKVNRRTPVGRKRSAKRHSGSQAKKPATNSHPAQSSLETSQMPPFLSSTVPQTDSFKVYRSIMNAASDSDFNSESSRSSATTASTDYSGSSQSWTTSLQASCGSKASSEVCDTTNNPPRPTSRSSRSDTSNDSQNLIPLEPLDLVWAKCRGYPWYPALIVNPDMPKTGYFHKGVPIPVPPDDVLDLRAQHAEPVYLVLFFDAKRTWQWLPRNKLEPLGVNSNLDQAKLIESRKPAERKAVKKAFEKAIEHCCRVAGEPPESGESDDDN